MKILIAGDYCPQDRVNTLLKECDYSTVLGEIKKETEKADFSIVNLECPVLEGAAQPIEKCGPNLSCRRYGIDALKWAGFDCVTLANNHILDYGSEGISTTLQMCKKECIFTVGAGINANDASKTLYVEKNGETLAIVNCCEHEFSIASQTKAGANPLNPIRQYYAIKEAHLQAKNVIVIVHGGKEHYQLPSPRMQELYRFFIDAGADAVINHHQHCFSGYELYGGKPIFYGLGNFCFDNPVYRNQAWNKGYFVRIDTEGLSEFEIVPYFQCDEEPSVRLAIKDAFHEEIAALNSIITNEERLCCEYENILDKNEGFYKTFLTPYSGRWSRALFKRGFLPSFLSKKRKLALFDFIGCESHVDFMLNLLKK